METNIGFNKKEDSTESRFMKVELSSYKSPIFYDHSNKDYVSWGRYNNFPYFLTTLANSHPEHGAVIRGKAAYILGKGLKVENEGTALEMAQGEFFLQNANRYETWDELLRKTLVNFTTYNGWAWQIIWNNAKTKFECFHIEFGKLRRSKCGKEIYYCDAWMVERNGQIVPNQNPEKHPSYKPFPLFNPNIRNETSIFYFKVDGIDVTENGNLYPKPEYEPAIREIETDINISNLRYHYSANGMFAQSMINFFNGDPSPKEKKEIKKLFDRTYGGSDNAGQMILFFNDKGAPTPTITTLTQSDLDKVFADTRKECQYKIFSAHMVAPVLFGIKTEGSLSDTSGEATIKEWDKFVRTWIEDKQRMITTEIENLAYIQGVDLDLRFEQTTPVGVELPSDANIHKLFDQETLRNYYAKKYGIEITTATAVSGSNPNVPSPITQVNENLKKLSGRDWQHIKRMVREVENGKTRRDVAAMMLKNAYALTDADIQILFNTPQSGFSKFQAEVNADLIADLFEKFAIEDFDGEELETFEVVDGKDVRKKKFLSEAEMKNFLIDAFQGNPYMTPEEASRQLNVPIEQVLVVLGAMVTAGLLLANGTNYSVTEKGLAKEPKPVEVETRIVYSYGLIDGIPDAVSSRAFCRKMVALSRNGKRWTRDAIDNITATAKQHLSMPDDWDAWSFRGGFYTNPNSGETTAYCRHSFKGHVKSVKKGE